MEARNLEARVASLEAEVARLRDKIESKEGSESPEPWWKKIAGAFEGDPYFAEAARLGREYRESLRPKPRKKSKKK